MDGLTAAALRHPRWTVAIYIGLIALAGVGALRLESETGYRAAIGAGHPSVERLDRFIADFGAGLPVQIAWGCDLADEPCSDALSSERLVAAERIAASVEALPGVLSVRTPGSTPLSDGTHGAIDSLTLKAVEVDAAERRRFIERVRLDPFWQGVLVAEDARAAALVLELESSDPHRHAATLHTLLEAIEAESGTYALVGDPVDFVLGGAALNREARKLGAVAMGLVALIVWLLFRTPLAIVPVLTAVGIAAIGCLGLMGWMGWPENEVSQAIVPLLLVIGVCASIHLMSRYRDLPTSSPRLREASRSERLVAAAGDVGWPCFVAALTTAVGLGSFVTSDLAGFVRFGIASSFGAFIALAATFTVLPVLIHALRLELPELPDSEGWARALRWLGLATRRYARTIVVGTAFLLLMGLGGILRLEVDVTKESLLGSESVIVRWQHWVAEHLRKPDSLEVRLRLPEGTSLAEVATLGVVADVAAFLESIPELGRTRSVLDGVEYMNQLLHGGEPAMARLGATRAENAQLLFALESYDRDLLSSWITPDRGAIRVSSEAVLLSRQERGALLDRVKAHLEGALPKGWSYELTGPLQVFADMVTELHKTQLRSFVGAMFAVAAAIALCLRSATAVVWAMFPSLLPIVITLGAMGWMGTPLDTGTAMIAAIVLGIAVDDSVHLIVRYRRHRQSGMNPSAAMTWSLEEVGRALVASSLALSAGFLVMLLSSWGGIAAFGLLSACAIQFALLADLLFLPALVYCLDHSSWEDSPESISQDLGGRQRAKQLVVACVALGAAALHAQVGFELSSAAPMVADATSRVHALLIGMSALLLGVCLFTAWRSREDGATPLALTGASIGALALSIAAPASETAAIAGVVALCLLPAALVHMGLVFPARRGVLAVSPLFLRMLYAVVALVVVVGLTTYFRFPLLYAFVAPMLLVAAGAAGFDLFLHARRHARTPVSAKERTQAQMLVIGSLATGALAAICYVAFQWMDRAFPGGSDSFFAFALLSAIGPLTYAIQPDRLFDIRHHGPAALRMAARGATLVALVVAFEAVLDSPTPSLSGFGLTVLLAWGSMEFVDRTLLKRLVAPRRRSKLEEIATFDSTVVVGGNLTTESEVANQIVARVQAALMPQFVAVFFKRPQGWFPAAASDSAPTEEHLAAAAYALVPNGDLTYLPESRAIHHSQRGGSAAALSTLLVEGVETLVSLNGERGRRGVVILGASSRMLSTRDRVYLTRLGRQAISALSWADAAEQLAAARALARRGFLSAALAHDLGKPLTTIWGAARSLRRLRATDELVDQRLLEMQQVADQGLAIIDQLFAKVKEEPGGTVPAGELVAMACRAAEEQHRHAIQIHYGSDLHGVSLASEIAEALGELLSNACRESPTGVPVEVSALVTRPNVLWIDVVDRGAGMTESVAARAFEPWFSQRQDVGGRGLGLALCRLLVRQVGGEVEIVDRGGRAGTRMRISVEVLPEIEGDS